MRLVSSGTQVLTAMWHDSFQYYLPSLDEAGEDDRPKFKLEYTTFPVRALHPPPAGGPEGLGGRGFAYPIPKRHLPRSLRNSTRTKSKKYAPYGLADLTIPSWTRLARRVGRKKGKTMRQRFKEFMSMGGAA